MARIVRAAFLESSWMSTLPRGQGKTGEMWTWGKTQPLAAVGGQKGLAGGVGLTRADR